MYVAILEIAVATNKFYLNVGNTILRKCALLAKNSTFFFEYAQKTNSSIMNKHRIRNSISPVMALGHICLNWNIDHKW